MLITFTFNGISISRLNYTYNIYILRVRIPLVFLKYSDCTSICVFYLICYNYLSGFVLPLVNNI